MSVAVSNNTPGYTERAGIGYDLAGYDTELRYEWGPYWFRNRGKHTDLGYPKTNILHDSHGLGGGGSGVDEKMTQTVKDVDKIVKQLPLVMQKAAEEWWVYNRCMSKRETCRRMTAWYQHNGAIKKVQPRDLDVWLSAVAMAVWIGLGGEDMK